MWIYEIGGYLAEPTTLEVFLRQFWHSCWIDIAFLPFNVARVHRLLPKGPAGLLVWMGFAGWLVRTKIGQWFSPDLIFSVNSMIDSQFVDRMRASGRRIIAWTVDKSGAEARRLLVRGVDGMITNAPLNLRKRLVEGGEG